MAASSIGQPVVLNEESARRLTKIMDKPYRPAKSKSGRKLKVSMRKFDPKKFE